MNSLDAHCQCTIFFFYTQNALHIYIVYIHCVCIKSVCVFVCVHNLQSETLQQKEIGINTFCSVICHIFTRLKPSEHQSILLWRHLSNCPTLQRHTCTHTRAHTHTYAHTHTHTLHCHVLKTHAACTHDPVCWQSFELFGHSFRYTPNISHRCWIHR